MMKDLSEKFMEGIEKSSRKMRLWVLKPQELLPDWMGEQEGREVP